MIRAAAEEDISTLLGTLTEGEFSQRSDHRADDIGETILSYLADAIRASAPTPVACVTVRLRGRPRTILLKLEGCSRWASMKRRTALALMASVANRVTDKTMVVESTSGNLGVALAGISADLGIDFTAVVDSRLPPLMSAKMLNYGARLEKVEETGDMLHLRRRIERVHNIVRDHPYALWPNQYENPANFTVHRLWTGPELGRQILPDFQALFAPVSTGGSFAGICRYFSDNLPHVDCVAVDVAGSTIFGGAAGCRLLTGIGASKPSPFIASLGNPPHIIVSDGLAISVCHTLADDAGISVGGSSGATIAACLLYLSDHPELDAALCVCPDLGDNYQETLYSRDWLARNGALSALVRPTVAREPVSFKKIEPSLT